jgi:hypothetical protein
MDSEDGAARTIAEFSDYAGMLDAIRARVSELGINGERFDEYAGLPKAYLSKLVGVRPVKRIGMVSMGALFNALGIKCRIVEVANGTERLKSRLKPRHQSFVRSAPTIIFTPRSAGLRPCMGAHYLKTLHKSEWTF